MADQDSIENVILECAIQVIELGGEVSVRTHKIAEICGVTAPVLYRIFTNREGLIIAAQAERYRRTFSEGSVNLADEIARKIARCLSKQDVIEAMKWFFDEAMRAERHSQRLIRLEVVGAAATRPELMSKVAETDKAIIQRFAKVFEVAVEHGWINSSIHLNALMTFWLSVILGRYLPEISNGFLDGEEWNKAAMESMLHLLFGEYERF